MNTEERERAQKFVRGKESYIVSRWLLRQTLGGYTGIAPEAVAFLRTDKGKPYLPHSDIRFSLSHSGHWVLLAIARTKRVGIDVEAVGATRDLIGIAKNYYHPQEYAQLETLSPTAQAERFYRLWTLKEAFLKATGTGISAGLDNIRFDFTEALEAGTTKDIASGITADIAPQLGTNANEWQFHQWALTERDYCALAINSEEPLAVSWFDALLAPAFS